MIGVIDASAVIRLFIPDGRVPDGLENFLRKAEQGAGVALAPELIVAEAANVLLKKHRRGELTELEIREILSVLMNLPIRLISHKPIIDSALDIAMQFQLTVYDSIYLAIARTQNACIFSADDQINNAARSLSLPICK